MRWTSDWLGRWDIRCDTLLRLRLLYPLEPETDGHGLRRLFLPHVLHARSIALPKERIERTRRVDHGVDIPLLAAVGSDVVIGILAGEALG